MYALTCLVGEEVERESREDLFRDYVGQALWHITTIQHLKTNVENEMPQYVELSHPEQKQKQLTAEEIKQHILEELRC